MMIRVPLSSHHPVGLLYFVRCGSGLYAQNFIVTLGLDLFFEFSLSLKNLHFDVKNLDSLKIIYCLLIEFKLHICNRSLIHTFLMIWRKH